MTQTSSDLVNNKHLFSNYYLENQISSTPEWGEKEHEFAFSEIKKIYDRELAFVANLNESQLEDRLFRDIFGLILPHYEVQGATLTNEFPDYAFFPDQGSQDRAQSDKDEASFFKEAFAIGEVKRWDVELDKFGKNRHDKRRNPSFQVWLYLHDTEPRWGVLSNGRRWRLYHQDKPLDVYYEVDLAAMLEEGDLEAFKYFYYFFRSEAFLPNDRGEVFLDVVLKGSADYAQEIGDNLKENVYRAMKKVAEGLFAWEENELDPADPAARAQVQRNTMILLYRFLFLLYAEGKSLLDLKDEQYRESYSFDRIKKMVAAKEDGPRSGHHLPIKTTLWGDFKDLFRLINRGSEELGIEDHIHVPAYNGGLFDPDKHFDLEKWTIGDSYLADAIDLLSRNEKDGETGFVDYSTLEIRHLGSIYEGLLEYRLEVAEEGLVVKGGKDRKWVSLEEFNTGRKKKRGFEEFDEFDRVKAGELYLTTDRGERKATGSYYTPDYIVNYIVENTVGPVVKERWEVALLREESLIEATLSVKVLDPAMGSGHFLVGAVEFLAGKLMEAAERDIEWGWVEDRGQFSNEWAKREAVSHCVYGVDLNELAVELAKVSLWLTTIAKEKPLSFLDHRLKQGNSLVGARLSDLKYYPGGNNKAAEDQVTLPSFVSPRFVQHLIGKIKELEDIGDDSLSDVKLKESVFEEFRALPEYTKARAIANVHTAVYFGNEVEPKRTPTGTKSADMVYHDMFWAVGGDESEWTRKTRGRWFDDAQEIAAGRSFFHWELEYPEIFFEGGEVKENPGWDAVVGNPPYVRQEILGELKGYFEQKFLVYHGVADLYVYFVERGMDLLRKDGFFSYILANKWMRANYGEPLRTWMKSRCIEEIVDFGDLPVFPEATTYPCILRLSGSHPESSFKAAEVKTLDFSSLGSYVNDSSYIVNQSGLDDSGWSLVGEAAQALLDKLRRSGTTLGEYVNGRIYYGIKTGLNEAFVIDEETRTKLIAEDPKSEELIKPFLAGRDIKRYEPPESGQYLILIPNGWTRIQSSDADDSWTWFEEKYPAISAHLAHFSGAAQKRYDKGEYWWELRACAYYDEFEKPKIIYAEIATRGQFTFETQNSFSDTTTYIMDSDSKYLLGVLNSKLWTFLFSNTSSEIRGGFYRWKHQYMTPLIIRRISFTTPEPERAALVSELQDLYAAGRFDEILFRVEFCLPKDAEGEKSDVVHDLLAYLAEEMMEMNKQKQAEMKGFLDWLEEYSGARVEDLTNKTKLRAYYELDFSELLTILKKNKRKLGADPTSRLFMGDLRREYDDSTATLRPLLAWIYDTDRLIDEVVYKLYGLTDAEIAMVEKAAG